MGWVNEILRRVGMLIRRRQFDEDLSEEMKLHLDLRREEQLARGIRAEDAESAARRQFGNVTRLREESRDGWGWAWLEQGAQDVRYAFRNMLRSPGFTLIAVTILALGIGANSAIFSVVNAVLLRPLAYKDSDRLVTVLHRGTGPVSPANYLDWSQQSRSFEAMGAAQYWTSNLTETDAPEKVWGLRLTQTMLPLLGVEPMLGRMFAPGEDQPGADREVVLSHKIWQRLFAGDRGVLGRSVMLDGAPYRVVGVMPPGFQFAPFWATRAEIFAPLPFPRTSDRTGQSLRVFARLRSGVSLEQARAEIGAITARLEQQFPGSNRNVTVTPLKENVVGKVETPLLFVMGAVGFVLLIACANVAHMLLARAASRQKEIALRSALGAGGWRLIRQFLAEGLLLAGCGAAAGLGLAFLGIRALVLMGPASIPRLESVTIDPRVLAFSLLIAVVTGVAFSFAPAISARTLELTTVLKENAKSAGGSTRLRRTRNLLAISEFALAFMLLAGAGLLVRSFGAMRSLDPGFDPSRVLSMVVPVAGSPQGEPGQREIFYRRIVEQIGKLPGVESSGAINHLPLAGDIWGVPFEIEGRLAAATGQSPAGVYRLVMPGYFSTMRLPVLRGRDIGDGDHSKAPGVAIINEEAARRYWPGEDPLGKRIRYRDQNWLTIVGVAKDAKQADWVSRVEPEVYLAALQNSEFLTSPRGPYLTLVLRTAGDPSAMAASVRNAIWSVNRNLPISEVLTMDGVIAAKTAQPRFEVTMLVSFAAVALLIAMAGIHALMSFSVSRRTHEIGVRMSLGASQRSVTASVLREGMALAAAGSIAGTAGALLLSRLMTGMLFEVKPADPLTFVTVAVVLNAAAALAIYFPARRAAAVDPIVALRCD
jgi:putative ABC transport system permease protein